MRDPGHGDVLLRALAEGRIDLIATDHAPHERERKLGDDIWAVASGFPGVETSLALFLTEGVAAGRLTLEQLVRATSEGPARTWGLWPVKGAIALGSDADLTLIDLAREGVIRGADAARPQRPHAVGGAAHRRRGGGDHRPRRGRDARRRAAGNAARARRSPLMRRRGWPAPGE